MQYFDERHDPMLLGISARKFINQTPLLVQEKKG
jgi:hypothetical protein